MTLPSLPAQGATSWYPWATGAHNAVGATAAATLKPSGGDDTTAIAAALASLPSSGGALHLAAGTFNVTSLTPPNNVTIRGQGDGTIINYTGTSAGTLLALTNNLAIKVQDLTLTGSTATSANYTLLKLDNSFLCEFRGVTFRGNHQTGAAQVNTTGTAIRGNAGDNRFIGCTWANLGAAIRTDSIQNYVVASTVTRCQRGVWGDQGSFGAGLMVESTTFVGASTTIAHVQVDVNANHFAFTNCWFEGADRAVQVGNTGGTLGPIGFAMIGCHVAAGIACIEIHNARQTYLTNIVFGFDPATTPTEIAFATGSAGGFGVMTNLISAQGFDPVITGGPPSGWVYFRTDTVELPRLKLTAATTGTGSPSAGGAGALPATPAGYVTVEIAGTGRQIPYY